MQSLKAKALVLLGCTALFAPRLSAQAAGGVESDPYTPAILTGQPFSAVRYTRTVRVEPGGRRVVTEEGHHVRMARNGDGRIYMAGAGMDDQRCDLPSLGKLPLCDSWGPFLFDPKAGMMWHWTEGEFGDKTQFVQIDLRDDQIARGEQLTSVLPKPPEDVAEPGVSVQGLGERDFKGIRAKGVRTTTMHGGPDGKPAATIHEVWTSTKMRLVLRVVDGDPQGEEKVSGLQQISLAPDPRLFQPPEERILRHWKDKSGFADGDIENLSEWLGR